MRRTSEERMATTEPASIPTMPKPNSTSCTSLARMASTPMTRSMTFTSRTM